MNVLWDNQFLPLIAVATSLFGGGVLFFFREEQETARRALNLLLAVSKLGLIVLMLRGAHLGVTYEFRYELVEGFELALRSDPFALLFASLSAVLWFLTTIYAIGYLKSSTNRSRFFGFFSWCVCATTGIALAANLLTFLVFYEMLTLATYPLIVHRGTEDSVRAGRAYLLYTIPAGALLLVAIAWLQLYVGTVEFRTGGFIAAANNVDDTNMRVIFAMLIIGFGVKAGLVPLHGWLPRAMVAPAPVSALLHAVAVVKAGAFGVTRTVYDVFGITYANELGVLIPLSIVASVTILYGSVRAVFQTDIKKRLAFSTVSQVSYIVLGATIFGPIATTGGIVHIVHQAVMKITLFFAAGSLAETLHIHKISDMKGVGRRMPWTMTAFTVAAAGMIGMPPTAGFITKWYLAQGALSAGQSWVLGVLVGSAILNAIYFLPMVYAAWFQSPSTPWAAREPSSRFEGLPSLVLPSMVTAALTLIFGLFAGSALSPLNWAEFIMELEYR